MKNQPSRFTFSRQRRTWSLHVLVLQRTAKKCTKNYNARAQLLFCSSKLLFRDVAVAVAVVVFLGPVHTNPFSNENGAVLLRFQKDLRPHLSFSYRFRPSTLQRRICLKTLLYPQCTWPNKLDACAFQYIGPRNWREIEATCVAPVCLSGYSRSSGLAPGRVYFDGVTVFR